MKMISNTLAIAWKDLQVLLKDRGMLAVIMLLPLVFGSLISTGYTSLQNKNKDGGTGITLKVYLVNEDDGQYGPQVVQALQGMPMLEMENLPGINGRIQADEAVAEGKKIAAIIIPADFSQKVDRHESTNVDVLVDPNQKQFASIVTGLVNFAIAPAILQGEIQFGIRSLLAGSDALKNASPDQLAGIEAQSLGAMMTQLQVMMQNPVITVNTKSLTNEAPKQIDFFGLFMPGFTVMFAFFLISAVGEYYFKEKDEGTFRRLLAAPIEKGSIIAGKILAFSIIVIMQVVLLFGVAAGVFGMGLGKSLLGLLLVTLALSLNVTSLGLMVAALSRSGKQADSIGIVLGFVLAGLGGCLQFGLTPLYRQDNIFAKISQFTPHAHALSGFYKIMSEGSGLAGVLPDVGILLGMAVLFFLIASWKMKWD